MNYENLSEDVKNKVYDMYLKEASESPFQEQFRYFIGRDFWINLNGDKFEHYYSIVNKQLRREKINKLIKKI